MPFGLSERILFTMLCSKRREEREFAIRMVLSIRGEQEMGDSSSRPRILPFLKVLKDLISWENTSEPVITCMLTKAELLKHNEKGMEAKYYPCHT